MSDFIVHLKVHKDLFLGTFSCSVCLYVLKTIFKTETYEDTTAGSLEPLFQAQIIQSFSWLMLAFGISIKK